MVPPGNLGIHSGGTELSHLQGASRVIGPMTSCAWQCPYNLWGVSAMELDARNAQVDSVVRELTVALLGLHTRCSGVTSHGPLQVCLHRQSRGWLSAIVIARIWSPGHERELQLMHLDKQVQTWRTSGTCTMDIAEDQLLRAGQLEGDQNLGWFPEQQGRGLWQITPPLTEHRAQTKPRVNHREMRKTEKYTQIIQLRPW